MAFQTKTDYCGLTAATGLDSALVVRDANENASIEKYQPQGQDGSFLATETFGADSAPSNTYGVKDDIELEEGDVQLGTITTVEGKKYSLEEIQIKTSAGAPTEVSATCQEVETGASDETMCHYNIPALVLSVKHHAQILFSAFTFTGSGCELTECSATAGSSVSKDKIAGLKISSDINSGVVTVTGTILQTGSTAPTVTPASGWVLTSPLNCTNPETAYKSYSFEVQKVLAKASS